MEYISLDLETTGLDNNNHQVIEVGAIYEDTLNIKSFDEIPKFHAIINHKQINGSAYALNMNQRILKILAKREKFKDDQLVEYDNIHNIVSPSDFKIVFYTWVYSVVKSKPNWCEPIKVNLAGKNVGTFDLPFFRKLIHMENHNLSSRLVMEKYVVDFHRRHLDPAILFSDLKLDTTLPDLSKCLDRAGLKSNVTHNAIEDAWQVIELLRTKY